jgi:hypothetical protein
MTTDEHDRLLPEQRARVHIERGSKTGAVAVGALIGALSIFAVLFFALPILILAMNFNPLIVFVGAVVMLIPINLWACHWIDRDWDVWIAGTRFEARMQKVRRGKRAQRPAEWITRGSDRGFALATALLDAIQVIALTRLITGRPTGNHRIVIASTVYSMTIAGLYSLIGFALGKAI